MSSHHTEKNLFKSNLYGTQGWRNRGRAGGVKKSKKCAYAIYEWSLSLLDLTVTIFQGKGSYSEFPLSLQFFIDNFMALLNLREKHIN